MEKKLELLGHYYVKMDCWEHCSWNTHIIAFRTNPAPEVISLGVSNVCLMSSLYCSSGLWLNVPSVADVPLVLTRKSVFSLFPLTFSGQGQDAFSIRGCEIPTQTPLGNSAAASSAHDTLSGQFINFLIYFHRYMIDYIPFSYTLQSNKKLPEKLMHQILTPVGNGKAKAVGLLDSPVDPHLLIKLELSRNLSLTPKTHQCENCRASSYHS